MINRNLLYHILYFAFWTFFCLSVAGYDWDPIHAVIEIDIRVFFEELGLQKWSYQLNGGMTRLHNLGTHHQSPWFLFFLSLGSYWGVKLFIPFIMTLSNIFLVKFLNEVLNIDKNKAFLYSMIFSLNGFWQLHFYHGHMTYSAQYLFLVSFLFLYHYLFHGSRQKLWIGILFFFGAYSLSIYQTLTYMGIPTFLSISILIIYLLLTKKIDKVIMRRLGFIFLGLTLSIAIYVPKILSALSYLSENKRSITFPELRSLTDVLYTFFIPTKTAMKPFFDLHLSPPWGIHEFSYFSFIYIWLFVFILYLVRKKDILPLIVKYKKEVVIITTAFLISFVLYLGDFSPNSPFRIINDLFFGGEQRVSQRYLLLGVGALNLLVIFLISHIRSFKKIQNIFIVTCVMGGFFQTYNLINIKDMRHSLRVYNGYVDAAEFNAKMQYVIVPIQRYPFPAYEIILNNLTTISGFAPVPYDKYIGKQFLDSKPEILKPYYFLRNDNGSELNKESKCFTNSYFTQTRIIIHETCPEKLNLLLTNIYFANKIENYHYSLSKIDGIKLIKKNR